MQDKKCQNNDEECQSAIKLNISIILKQFYCNWKNNIFKNKNGIQ